MVDSRKVMSVRVMERLSQVTEDLEEIVKITQGKKPEKSVSGHLIKSRKKSGNVFFDAYRSIVLQDLAFGRKLVTAYLMGKEMSAAFSVNSVHDVTHTLESLGAAHIQTPRLKDHEVMISIGQGITCRGLKGLKRPVCFLEAGLLSGLLEKIFQKKVEIQETKCAAMGDSACQFELYKPLKQSQTKNPYLAGLLSEVNTGENLKLLTTLATHALTAIDNTLLFEKTQRQAVIDSLTEIFNHRYFQQMIRVELRRSERHGFPFSLVMLDVDDFKTFNDHFGHPKGDELLKKIAALLKSSIRDIDIAARYGGDEFAIILPQTDMQGAIRVCERIRTRARDIFQPWQGKSGAANLGLSLGVNSVNGGEEVVPQKFIDQADKALLRAKKRGHSFIALHRPRKFLAAL